MMILIILAKLNAKSNGMPSKILRERAKGLIKKKRYLSVSFKMPYSLAFFYGVFLYAADPLDFKSIL